MRRLYEGEKQVVIARLLFCTEWLGLSDFLTRANQVIPHGLA